MLAFLNSKKDCTGCGACMNVCPTQCISMEADSEGFLYPVADDRCIHCDKCRDVCPLANGKTAREPGVRQYSAAAISRDSAVWEDSSSGGAFTEICNTYGDHNTVVFGAAFERLKVVHSHVVGVKNIGKFRRSKYVQSDSRDSYVQAKRFLGQGRKVIFTGTPCQIAGLRAFLGREYHSLLTVEFICHGVGSPGVFEEALRYISRKYGNEIIGYSFRVKRSTMGNLRLYVSQYDFSNNKTVYVDCDEYNRLFLHQLCLRPSCGNNCKFRTEKRLGDITIADLKGKNRVFPKLMDYRNYSAVVVNSEKGDEVFHRLSERMDILTFDLAQLEKYNPLFSMTTSDNPLRSSFFKDFQEGLDIATLARKYVPVRSLGQLDRIKDFVPYRLRSWRLRLLKKNCPSH